MPNSRSACDWIEWVLIEETLKGFIPQAFPQLLDLGHHIRDGNLMVDENKVRAIQEWNLPTREQASQKGMELYKVN